MLVRLPVPSPELQGLVTQIERAFRGVGVMSFADATALPSAADNPFRIAYVTDIDRLAFSNGTDWIELTPGATL